MQVSIKQLLAQATITSWKIGWNFTEGEALRQQQDIFTHNVNAIELGNSAVKLQSFVNNTVLPFHWTGVNFLAYRATSVNPSNGYGVRTPSSSNQEKWCCVQAV